MHRKFLFALLTSGVLFLAAPSFLAAQSVPAAAAVAGSSVSLDYLEPNEIGDRLMANIPNPFREKTTLEFNLAHQGSAQLDLFDAAGNFIATLLNENLEPGRYRLTWTADGFSSGAYFVRMKTGDGWNETRRVVLVK